MVEAGPQPHKADSGEWRESEDLWVWFLFEVKSKANCRGRNPQTGETITIDARRVLTFKPSYVLRDAINS